MPSYPLILTNLDRVRVLVIGGGSVAERKAGGLIAGGARPIVISPTVTAALATWHAAGAIDWQLRRYASGDLVGMFLVVAATNDTQVNAQIAIEAAHLGILANIGDDPAQGNCTTTATVRRGDLLLAVSTNGASPALTARIRRELEATYGEAYANLLDVLQRIRAGPAQTLPAEARTKLLRALASDEVLSAFRSSDTGAVNVLITQLLAAHGLVVGTADEGS